MPSDSPLNPLPNGETKTDPGLPTVTPPSGGMFFRLFGVPALSMPCGKAKNGMPIGLQLIGAAGSDARLLRIAKTLEGLLDRQP